jgi:hypothetical protein
VSVVPPKADQWSVVKKDNGPTLQVFVIVEESKNEKNIVCKTACGLLQQRLNFIFPLVMKY